MKRTLLRAAAGVSFIAIQASAVITVPSDTHGTYVASQANNTYQVNTTKGKINITGNNITLTGGTLNAAYVNSGSPDSAVLVNANGLTDYCNNLTVNSFGSDTKYCITSWKTAPFNVTGCNCNSSTATRDGVEPGNGTCSGGTMKVDDDSVKLYQNGAQCQNTTVNQQGGGSALQFGWGSQSQGTSHTGSGNTVSGKGYSNETWEPNRGWVGGMANSGRTLDGISVSSINIQSLNIGSAVYLVGNGGTVKNVNVSGTKIAGNFPLGTLKKKTQNGGAVLNVTVNLP